MFRFRIITRTFSKLWSWVFLRCDNCFEDLFHFRHSQVAKNTSHLWFLVFFFILQTSPGKLSLSFHLLNLKNILKYEFKTTCHIRQNKEIVSVTSLCLYTYWDEGCNNQLLHCFPKNDHHQFSPKQYQYTMKRNRLWELQSNLYVTVLYLVVTQYITVTGQLPKVFSCLVQMYFLQSRLVCSSHPACNGHLGIFQWLTLTGLTVIKSSKEKWFDLLSNSLNYFVREMYTVLRSV